MEPSLKAVVEHLARSLVSDPDAVEVSEEEGDRGAVLRLTVAPDDMGKVIGRSGRTARAIRTVVRAAAGRTGGYATVEIVEQPQDAASAEDA